MNDDVEELEKAKIFLKLAIGQGLIIQQAIQRLNGKIKGILAITSTLIPIVVGLGYFIIKETKIYWMLIPISLSLGIFLWAVGKGIVLQMPTDYFYVDPSVTVKKHHTKPLKYIINKLASTYCDVVNYNASSINKKEKSLKEMCYLVLLGLIILVVSFFFLAINLIIKSNY